MERDKDGVWRMGRLMWDRFVAGLCMGFGAGEEGW